MQPALIQKISEVISEEYIMGGHSITDFEQDFAAYCGVSQGVSCGNCTDALEIILRAMEISPGDEVIVPANGWLSAAEVVKMLGAVPVLVDPHPEHYVIEADEIEKRITSRTVAIIPIHLYGRPAPMHAIMALAEKHQLKVIEDCAQAHGARIGSRRVGSFGHAAAFSFYPTKNLGALGDGGMMLTNDPDLASRCRWIANHGQSAKNKHIVLGRNSRMDTLQAAVLNLKLGYLDEWNDRRRAIARHFLENWQGLPITLPEYPDEAIFHVYHLFVIQVENRDKLQAYLASVGIDTAVHYPEALPQMEVFRKNYHAGAYPQACAQANKVLSIPVYPELNEEEVSYITQKVGEGITQIIG